VFKSDFWSRVANIHKTNAVIFNLANEPNLPTEQWVSAANAAIAAIRATGSAT
jgi:endoglucanase